MIRNFFLTAWRNLLRSKVYTIINIAGLSLGLASAMLIVLYTKDELSYDKFHEKGSHIFRIVNTRVNADGAEERPSGVTGYMHGAVFAAQIPEITAMVRYQGDRRDLQKKSEVISEEVVNVDSNFLQVFSFRLLHGDAKTALTDRRSVVVTAAIAEKYFASTDVVGKALMVNEDGAFVPYTITAVVANPPQNSTMKFGMLMQMQVPAEAISDKMNWFNFFLNTFVVLAPGSDVKRVEEKMKQVYQADSKEAAERLAKEYNEKGSMRYFLQPLEQLHLGAQFGVGNGLRDGSDPWYSYILGGIALFILMIACINFVNLTVARSVRRAREIGIRKVIGSTRGQLIGQFIGESFVLTVLAFALALLLVQWALPVFNNLANKALSISYLFDAKLVLVYVGLLVLTALLAGFYPALVLSNFEPVKTLYNRFRLGGKNYLQNGLVVLQFTLATFLIIGTITIYRQFNFMLSKPLGYNDKDLVKVENWRMSRPNFQRLRNELLQHNAIVEVGAKNEGTWQTGARINGATDIQFAYETVSTTTLPMLQIPILQGRNFDAAQITDSTQSILVNESFVKEAGWKNPIGQEVNFFWDNNRRMKVIGVVKDYHFASVNQKIIPQVVTMWPENEYGQALIKIKPGREQEALAHIAQTFKAVFPIAPYTYQFVADVNRSAYESEDKWKQMLLFGAVLTIFISCIGLFGLSVLNAERRLKEVGVRKVLGASVKSVAWRLSTDFVKLVGISLVLAIPLSVVAVRKWLENYPYRIETGWSLFAMASVLVIGIAMLTISFQAIKAAMANPVRSLRNE